MRRLSGVAASAAIALLIAGAVVRGQSTAIHIIATDTALRAGETAAASQAALQGWAQQIAGMAQRGDLLLQSSEGDLMVAGRTHNRFTQYHRGVPVFGGAVVQQANGFGVPTSIFGVLYPDIGIDVTPVISQPDATVLLSRAGQGAPFVDSVTELYVLPHGFYVRPDDGRYELAWSARILSDVNGHVNRLFIDAVTGNEVFRYDDTQTQSFPGATGIGVGVAGDSLKLQTLPVSGQFRTVDQINPGQNTTFDLQGNSTRATQLLNGVVQFADSDIASDADNQWGDPAIASTHSYGALTYLYYARKFSRKGLNNNNLKIRQIQNPARVQDFAALSGSFPLFFNNAAYYGAGVMAYGVGGPGNRNFAASIDVVAHELTHGVTAFTSNLIYQNESGALNEAFSDMMGVAIEFEFQQKGAGLARAEWLLGEDVRTSGQGLRNLAVPGQQGDPDHYSIRFLGSGDNGGVHTNSGIMNHVFYLAIEGGTHRLSGVAVQGVGFDNRFQIEQVIYRAFTSMLPANATFAMAKAAVLQAARDIHGAGSNADRALTQAWAAVGVN